jgi:hypothetical protein
MKSRRTMKKRTEELVREVSLQIHFAPWGGRQTFVKRLFAW